MPAPTSDPGAAEPGPPRTELQEVQFKTQQVTDEVKIETFLKLKQTNKQSKK